MTELTITRFIAAPRQHMWQILAHRQEEWWCPAPWRAEFDSHEKRAGGRCDMPMYGPDGEVHPNRGIYLAWDEGRRFVSTDAIQGDFAPAEPFMIGLWEIAPEERDGVSGTIYTARARHWSQEACRRHQEMGSEAGWGACADQLKALCEAT